MHLLKAHHTNTAPILPFSKYCDSVISGCTIISQSSTVRCICRTCAGFPLCVIICTVLFGPCINCPICVAWYCGVVCRICCPVAVVIMWPALIICGPLINWVPVSIMVGTDGASVWMGCTSARCRCSSWRWVATGWEIGCNFGELRVIFGNSIVVMLLFIWWSSSTVMPLMYWRSAISDFSTRVLNAWQRLTWCKHWTQILSGHPSLFSIYNQFGNVINNLKTMRIIWPLTITSIFAISMSISATISPKRGRISFFTTRQIRQILSSSIFFTNTGSMLMLNQFWCLPLSQCKRYIFRFVLRFRFH